MSVSAISDSKLDLQSTLEVRDDQDIFKAALPYLVTDLAELVTTGAIAILAFKVNLLVIATFSSIVGLYSVASLGSTILAMRASKNVVEFNEVIKTVMEKVHKSSPGVLILGTTLAFFI